MLLTCYCKFRLTLMNPRHDLDFKKRCSSPKLYDQKKKFKLPFSINLMCQNLILTKRGKIGNQIWIRFHCSTSKRASRENVLQTRSFTWNARTPFWSIQLDQLVPYFITPPTWTSFNLSSFENSTLPPSLSRLTNTTFKPQASCHYNYIYITH